MRFVKWLFAGAFRAEFDRGYREAIDKILLLPEKLRIGTTLEVTSDRDVAECTFVGGSPAVLIRGDGSHLSHLQIERCETGIHIVRATPNEVVSRDDLALRA